METIDTEASRLARTTTDPGELRALLRHAERNVRVFAMLNPAMLPAWLHIASERGWQGDATMRYHALRNVACPADTLAAAAASADVEVRRAVAGNPNTPIGIVRAMLADESEKVRRVAESVLTVPPRPWAEREDRRPRARTMQAGRAARASFSDGVNAAAAELREALGAGR